MFKAFFNILTINLNKKLSEEKIMVFVNYFAFQVELGWITLEQVPKKYREKVRIMLEAANEGLTDEEKGESK